MADNSPDNPTTITPTEFAPLDGPIKQQRRGHPIAVAITVALLVAAVALWFLLTARAVSFETTPASATIKLDSALSVKLSDRYLVRPGNYQLEAHAEGYFPLQQSIEVTTDDSQHHKLQLEKKPGHLQLTTSPSGATITIDGETRGQTPVLISDLSPGEHQLHVMAPRHFAHSATVNIIGLDQTQPLNIELEPAWGQLSLNSQPAGAVVLVSGQKRGVTPLTTELLSWGKM